MDAFKPKPLLNKSELRQMKRSKTRIEGKKILTDDVKKLKSLRVQPELTKEEAIDYYKEPIWIEYYIPKESRFAFETKYLYIPLVDPDLSEEDPTQELLRQAKEKNQILDIIDILENQPEAKAQVLSSYHYSMNMLEHIHQMFGAYRETGETKEIKTACYVTEALLKYEPTLASLQYFKDFSIYNLNFWIRELNKNGIEFSLEDTTVSLLIKRRNELWEKEDRKEDPDFDLLTALFFEQAFPNRGASDLSPEDLMFDKNQR